MKKLLLVAITAILVAGCAKTPADLEDDAMVMEETGAMEATTEEVVEAEVVVEEPVVEVATGTVMTGEAMTGEVMTGN